MKVSDFDFALPADLIAQEPASQRESARLLRLDRHSGSIGHSEVSRLPELLGAGDLLVVNSTRVFPARLIGHRVPSGGAVECLLVRRIGEAQSHGAPTDEQWEALVHPGQKLKEGARVRFTSAGVTLHGEILERRFFGRRTVRLWTENGVAVESAVDAIGHVPLPPYIKRVDAPGDRERYQTVFAAARGSIAAPTAGLHFTKELVAHLTRRGIEVVDITLHVGYGTFQPVRALEVEDHRVEAESYVIDETAASTINRALQEHRRIVAVGTTTTRTLESVGRDHDGRIVAARGTTDLFIFPGFPFRVVGGLITNFHLPRSSLLMLVAAFAGRDHVLAAYAEAVREGYRFYSYGDAMLVL